MQKSLSLEQQYQALQAQNERLQCLLVQQEKQIAEHHNTVIALQEKENLIQQKENMIQEKESLIQEQDNLIRNNENAIRQKEEIIRIQKIEMDYLKERLSILLSKRFKAQSEQLKYLQGQLFDEAELEKAIQETQQAIAALETSESHDAPAPASEADAVAPPQSGASTPEKPKRKKLPESLRRVEVIIDRTR